MTADLKTGVNVLGSQLSYGWYAGYLGYSLLVGNPVVRAFYGKVPLLKAQLEVSYNDGSTRPLQQEQTGKPARVRLPNQIF